YKKTYGDQLIWKLYRRNTSRKFFTNPLPAHWCLKFGKFATNWPCPICRDEYLVVDYRLLKQFLVEATGHLYENHVVNVCQVNYHKIAAEVMKAKNRGYLTFDLPFRNYDYKDYYSWWNGPKGETVPEEPECYEVGRDKPYTQYPIHNPEHKPYW
uniref:Small ribosomal subunit protein mS40 n=1 Tax=Romanomermis culicivorax TaxID=13658 RepID=A0A915JX43_ROMCU